MKERKRRRLKKFNLHPVTSLILLAVFTIFLSFVLSRFDLQSTYRVIDSRTNELRTITVEVRNMFNYDGFKYIFSNAASNFGSFSVFLTLIIGLIGVSITHASGLIDAVIRRITFKMSNKFITFSLIFIAISSNIVNDIGYAVLIPIGALVFLANKRSPLLGITAAFCGVAFGYGTSLFVGSLDVSMVPITTMAARLIDSEAHVALLSNLFIMMGSTIILSIVGTMAIESMILKKIGRYRLDDEILEETSEHTLVGELDDKEKIEREVLEKRGVKYAFIALITIIAIFIYMITPGLPGSGILLDTNRIAYTNQLFGAQSYFKDGFTYMTTILLMVCGVAYGIGAKTIKNDKDLFEKAALYLKNIGYVALIVFFFVQALAIFKQTNIGLLLACYGAEIIQFLAFKNISLIMLTIVVVAFTGLFYPSTLNKWIIFSPVVVPMMMQSNISPQFAQFIFRAADSITKGITPFMGFFVIYLAYLNIYNTGKDPVSIRKALAYVYPYFIVMVITWICIILGWYLIGIPIGPGVYPTL